MNAWEQFAREKLTQLFTEKKHVIDIGGGLRIDRNRNNRYSADAEWMRPLIEKIDYKILDPVPDYNPDIVGDIHALPFADNSQEAIICKSVLEHVENPIQAVNEMYRVLQPGGYCFIYVPFLYYYHAERGYYKDYWRFTADTLDMLFKKFSKIEMIAVRGRFATWIHLSPLGKMKWIAGLANLADTMFKKESKQVSGYNVFLVK